MDGSHSVHFRLERHAEHLFLAIFDKVGKNDIFIRSDGTTISSIT